MDGGMVEAGAMFACLMALIKVIEKLVDQKFGKKQAQFRLISIRPKLLRP